MHRSFDAEAANLIINDPEVFATIAKPGLERLDVTEFVRDPGNVLMMAEGGAILFAHDIEPGFYEVHTNFLPGFRGAHAIEASLAAYRWMFTHTDCMMIRTRVPAPNRPAAMAARAAGFVPRFVRAQVWPAADGPVDLRYYELAYADWVSRARGELVAAGVAFHHRLDEERARHGVTAPGHADDPAHDLYVGAAIETVYGGQPEKAVILYNRWARFAGYCQIALVARSPLIIDIGDAVLLIEDGTFKVVSCRPAL